MSVLVRGDDLIGRPVVTLEGERLCEVKDVVVHHRDGRLVGFTLRDPGLLGGPRKDSLNWDDVHGVGGEAVVVRAQDSLTPVEQLAESQQRRGTDVLSDRVLTDAGTDLGEVSDVILSVSDGDGASAVVVGYELKPSDALATSERTVLIPLPAQVAISGENLVVPDAAREFVGHDLAGFGASVQAFRARLDEASGGGAA